MKQTLPDQTFAGRPAVLGTHALSLKHVLAGRIFGACLVAALAAAQPTLADDIKPKLGPLATPIFAATDYLRHAPAPDYWALSPHYAAQTTSSNCSLATATMAVNMLRGLPFDATQPIVTQAALLDLVGDEVWRAQVAEGGPGTTFAEFTSYVRESLAATDIPLVGLQSGQFDDAGPAALASLRDLLATNEASDESVLLLAFNQGVITGDWDGPHASPVGAYDAANDRVLILDVDREWYVPYWTDTATLLAAMVKPISAEHGRLAGDRGGYVFVAREPR